MKRTQFFISSIIFSSACTAQQLPHYTQYVLNQYIINPALSGIENYTDIKFSHRKQWTGINGAPETSYFTIQTPIAKKDYKTTATSFDVPGENPRGTYYWEGYTASKPHHGIGLQIFNDKAGPVNNFTAYATYAYHIGISAKTSLAGGIGAGFNKYSLDASKLSFTTVDPVVYSSGVLTNMHFNLTAGLYLYSSDYFVGLSAQQILSAPLDYSNNEITTNNGKVVPHLFATAGYRFLLNDNINVIPSLMVKYVQPLPLQPEVNIKFQYNDLLWTGLGYRYKDGFSAMLGLNVLNTFNVSYSYDYTTSALNIYSGATNEIMIGFILGNNYKTTCPKNIW